MALASKVIFGSDSHGTHDPIQHSTAVGTFRILLGQGRAIAQAVSRWLPTAAARVQTRV
jgi:hypothetical protein